MFDVYDKTKYYLKHLNYQYENTVFEVSATHM